MIFATGIGPGVIIGFTFAWVCICVLAVTIKAR
jgi:hypothetical protein